MTAQNDENYRLLIESEWKDLHHSRIQEWSALGIIAAAHIGLVQFLKLINETEIGKTIINYLTPLCCIIALTFSVIGILMVCRHRRLMWVKLNWIYEAEDKLGLIKKSTNPSGIIPEVFKMKNDSKKNNDKHNKEKESDNPTDKNNKSKWNNLMWPRRLSTSWLMAMIYLVFGIIDFGILVSSIIMIIIK